MVIRNTNHVMSDSCATYYKRVYVCMYVYACIAKIRVWLFIKVILLDDTTLIQRVSISTSQTEIKRFLWLCELHNCRVVNTNFDNSIIVITHPNYKCTCKCINAHGSIRREI